MRKTAQFLLIFLIVFAPCVSAQTLNPTGYLFNGERLKPAKVSDGRLDIADDITSGNYGAFFYTGTGYHPQTFILRNDGKTVDISPAAFKRLEDDDKGVLTGVIYKPVSGGKLAEHRGIKKLYGNYDVRLKKDSTVIKVTTDKRGVFTAVLQEGEYRIILDGRDKDKVVIKAGETVIRNIQKGAMLID